MPLRKIGGPEFPEDKEKYCTDPEHNPPTHLYLTPGTYEHECPACHRVIIICEANE
jgi:hypothetical protein